VNKKHYKLQFLKVYMDSLTTINKLQNYILSLSERLNSYFKEVKEDEGLWYKRYSNEEQLIIQSTNDCLRVQLVNFVNDENNFEQSYFIFYENLKSNLIPFRGCISLLSNDREKSKEHGAERISLIQELRDFANYVETNQLKLALEEYLKNFRKQNGKSTN
jgi:hypothetical protein